jgi:hypothetical protein
MKHAESDTWGGVGRFPKGKDDDPTPELLFLPPAECERLFEVFLHVKEVWEWSQRA